MENLTLFTDYQEYMEMEHLYNAALKQLQIRFEILNGEFKVKHDRSPIHHIQSRLKSTKSIIKKLSRLGHEISIPSAMKNINDLAGIRVVCSYIDDVYNVADMFLRQNDIRLIKKRDYIKTPNYNGYRSLHLDVEIPVFLSDHTRSVMAEIQIRTVAMDFWASLEHDLRYKSDKNIPQELCEQMLACADEIAIIDKEMQEMYKEIQNL
ncbi:MAG: GTP pyrophosphokinase family protein [Clostridia bacterium]|nr:GTP pyrophosphokinase family protein [Clostridia bacterium]